MRWATRRHCHVDRAACAWLIRRFIDPEATLVFVDDSDDTPPDATGFDSRRARGLSLVYDATRCWQRPGHSSKVCTNPSAVASRPDGWG